MNISANMVKELREVTGAGMMDCKQALSATAGDMDAAITWLREKGIAKSAKKESRIAAEGLANIFVNGNKAIILEVNSETDFVSKNDEFKNMIETIGNTILASNNVTSVEEALEVACEDGTIKDLIVAKTSKIGEKLSLRRFLVIEKKDDEVFGTYLHMGGKIAALTVLKGTDELVAKDTAMQVAALKPLYLNKEDVPSDVLDNERQIEKEKAMNEGKSEDLAVKMVEGKINKYYKEVCLNLQAFIKDGNMNVETYAKNNNCEVIKMVRYEVGEGMEKRSENFAEEVMKQVKKD